MKNIIINNEENAIELSHDLAFNIAYNLTKDFVWEMAQVVQQASKYFNVEDNVNEAVVAEVATTVHVPVAQEIMRLLKLENELDELINDGTANEVITDIAYGKVEHDFAVSLTLKVIKKRGIELMNEVLAAAEVA